MTEIFLHIRYLLKNHPCVILPGIGAFIVTHVEAKLNPEKDRISPPSRLVTFNADIANNDLLLVNSIARRERITHHQAAALLDRKMAEINSLLDNGSIIDLPGIGSLSRGRENRTVFQPADSTTSFAARQGLYTLALPKRPQMADVAEEKKPEKQQRVFSDKNYYIAINKTFAKVAASLIAIAMVAAAALWIPSSVSSDRQMAAAPSQDQAAVIPVPKAVSQPKADRKVEEKVCKYQLIVGTFTTLPEVERFKERHSGQQLRFLPGKKVMRLSLAQSDDFASLVEIMKSEEVKNEFGQLWIMEMKDIDYQLLKAEK